MNSGPGKVAQRDMLLRKRAEDKLASQNLSAIHEGEAAALIHELRVHQIELELQNQELIEAHRDLEEARNNYLDLYESSPAGYLTLSADGVIETINPSGVLLLAADADSLLHMPFASFVQAEDRDLWRRSFAELMKQEGSQSLELRIQRRDEPPTPLHLDCRRKLNGAKHSLYVSFSDITRIREAELVVHAALDELRRSNEELTHFAYIASHDLQEPLNTIIRYVQWIEKHLTERLAPSEKEVLDFIIGAAKRLRELVAGLLSYSRIDARSEAFAPIETSIAVERVLESLEAAMTDSNTEITIGPLPTIVADCRQIETLFQNLLLNAIKYRNFDRPSQVHISALDEPEAVSFLIADNGIGIDPAFRESIFIIFKRLHSAQTYPGTGIGLALCKRIVERHKGKIWVEPNPEGGSLFKFTIPKPQAQRAS